MAGHRSYHRCNGITAAGERCKGNSLPGEAVCVVHLPASDRRRIDHMADVARRRDAYWQRWRIEQAAAKAA